MTHNQNIVASILIMVAMFMAAFLLWCCTGCTPVQHELVHNPVHDIPKLDHAGLLRYIAKRKQYLLNKEPLDLSKFAKGE